MSVVRSSPRALILAAGRGTRLRPLTDDKPKCLTELDGHPLLELQLTSLRRAGINDISVLGGYKAECLSAFGAPVILNPRFAETNMVHSLFCARDHFVGEQDLLVSYSDIVYEPGIVHSLLDCAGPVGVAVDMGWRPYWEARFPDPLSDAETLQFSATDGSRILKIGQTARSYDDIQAQYIGLILFRHQCFEALRTIWDDLGSSPDRLSRRDNLQMTKYLQELVDRGVTVRASRTENGWLEVDTVSDMDLYIEMHENHSLHRFFSLPRTFGK